MERITELTALQRRCVPRALAAAVPRLAASLLRSRAISGDLG